MNSPTPYTKEYYEYFNKMKMESKSCNICMNEMKLIHSINGDYWICKVCNNTIPDF